jgi:16S rRNA (cytidine1402-2'-O)-methyltransferase
MRSAAPTADAPLAEPLVPGLYLVPTPVGNLGDITLRAVDTLAAADLIAAEDTRHSGLLLKHLGIARPLVALHQHNEHARTADLIDRVVNEGLALAVITDAGTPGLSDPGYFVVQEAIGRGLRVEVLPGPTALIPALVGSGLPLHRFAFEGFLPVKKGRQTRLRELAGERRTLAIYESPHRLARTLRELAEQLGPQRAACVARELSKRHETFHRGTLAGLAEQFTAQPPKGECVIVVGPPDTEGVDPEDILPSSDSDE